MALSDTTGQRLNVALGSPAAGGEVTAAINAGSSTGVTPGTVLASSVVVVDASKNVGNFGNVTFDEAKNLIVGTTTGSKIGTSVSQKLGFWNATPVIQQASANQAALTAQSQTSLTDNSGGSASTTLASISDTATKNAVASLAAELALIKTDVAGIYTLLTAMRTALVNTGMMKGAA